jgi:hypothetical protein
MWAVSASRALLAVMPILGMAGACDDDPAHVTLKPVSLPASCGRPANVTGIRVIAYTEAGELTRAVGRDEQVDLADFPSSTEQIGVEVAIGGGALGAIGKTAPLEYGELADKALVPIVMIPPGGMCETAGFMSAARRGPLLARAGAGVLVVGGRDAAGNFLGSADYYDPATATFTVVPVSDVLGSTGFAGASLATLPDGRVALSGGPQSVITIFDPATRTFGESKLILSRAFHTSIAVGEDRVMLSGGCTDVAAGACAGFRNSSIIYETNKIGDGVPGPTLHVSRYGASVFDLGNLDDGKHWYVIAGGTAPPAADQTGADLMSPSETDSVSITGLRAQVAALDGGALISAYAADGDPPSQVASLLAAGGTAARASTLAPPLVGARLVTLEDGRVAGFGGTAGDIQLYDPTIDRWSVASPMGGVALVAPSLVPLPDGTVLVVDGGAATQRAYLYRPSLIGRSSGSVTVVPADSPATVLTPSDPESIVRTPTWDLIANRGDLARALVGGPKIATGSVRATVRVKAGGVALLADQTGPGQVLIGELPSGAKARIVRREGGSARVLCTGKQVGDLDPALAVTVRLELTGTTAHLFRDDEELASCDVGAVERGAWGVAALGADARVAVETVTVAR